MRLRAFLHKLKTASSFTPLQWQIFLLAYFFLIQTRLALRISPSRLVEKALSQKALTVPDDKVFREELLRYFHLAWRYQIKPPNCLPTALAKQALLAHFGFSTRIRIGVQKENEILKAHAWLENASGEVLQEANSFSYSPLNYLKNEAGHGHI